MTTVTIYKITIDQAYMMSEQGEGFGLRGWSGDDGYYSGWDDGGKEYVLPKGYHVAEGGPLPGEYFIFDADDRMCDIVMHSSGRPQLVGYGPQWPVLDASA